MVLPSPKKCQSPSLVFVPIEQLQHFGCATLFFCGALLQRSFRPSYAPTSEVIIVTKPSF